MNMDQYKVNWIFMVRILDIRLHLICYFIQEVPTIWAVRFPIVLTFVDPYNL